MNLGAPFERLRAQLRTRGNGTGAALEEAGERTFRAGRLLGLVLLLIALGVRVWDPLPVATLRLELFDTYQRRWQHLLASSSDPRADRYAARAVPGGPGPAVLVVDIDEASLAEHGQWPWPRTKLADMIGRLVDMGARGILLDIAFAERDRLSPQVVADALPDLDPAARDLLRALPDNDDRLAEVIARGPVVLTGAVIRSSGSYRRTGALAGPRAAIASIGPDPRRFLPSHPALLHNIDKLEAAASGIGISSFNVDRDGILRRLPLLFHVDGYDILPGAWIELLRVAQGESTIRVRSDESGIRSISVGEVVVPTDGRGEIWLAFGPILAERYVPASAVLAGEVRREWIDGRLVVVGSTATGLKDFRATPVTAAMPGVDILAQTIEGLLTGAILKRPDYAITIELLVLLAVGFLVIWAVPRLGALGNIALSLGLVIVLAAASWTLFVTRDLLLDWSFPVVAGTIINMTLVLMKFADERRARHLVNQRLMIVRQEMEAARRVQQAILPTVFPNTEAVEVHAGTWPAREVGGDFYDVFTLPDGRIGFVVADVSGKGMDAALFMAVARTLLKAHAHTTGDPATCLERLNDDLSQDNDACMFVTVFYGLIDPETGRIEFSNGGHNAPYLKRRDGSVEALPAADGFAVGIVPGAPYGLSETRLDHGDALVLYTDGVTEAFSLAGEEFSERRLEDVLNGAEVSGAEPLVQRIVVGVRRFAAGGSQSDDITCMVVLQRQQHELRDAADD